MNNENNTRAVPPEENSKLGLIVVLAFAIGLPLLGILAKLLGY